MDNIINFKYGETIDNGVFYEKIWKKFYCLVFVKKKKYIILDIYNVGIVKSEVLPKLCCLGIIAGRYGTEIEININPASKVKDFLSEIGFFDIVNRYGIFYLDKGQIGGHIQNSKVTKAFLCFDKEEILKKYDSKYEFSKKITPFTKLKYCIEAEIFGERYLTYQGEITQEMIRKSQILTVLNEFCDNLISKENTIHKLGLDFVELIHNSLWHGKSKCFFSVQAGMYSKDSVNRFKRIDVCVADVGNGLYESMYLKDWDGFRKTTRTIPLEQFLSLKIEKEKNFYAILEMIFYRKDDICRGIYDIMEKLVDKESLELLLNLSMSTLSYS